MRKKGRESHGRYHRNRDAITPKPVRSIGSPPALFSIVLDSEKHSGSCKGRSGRREVSKRTSDAARQRHAYCHDRAYPLSYAEKTASFFHQGRSGLPFFLISKIRSLDVRRSESRASAQACGSFFPNGELPFVLFCLFYRTEELLYQRSAFFSRSFTKASLPSQYPSMS